ncbi:polynucleotidyl transferase [Striga asiatica]|uniref:Polynucleotidyl transferase n=1 Tax=Striga asiatica TaxID=4170 RepID=A0A5A7QMN6_STRAF|nr:polynucleotidyl transferase [Striga asiatica]
MEASDIGKVVAEQGEVFRWPQGARFKSLESCVKHTSTVPPLSTAVVRLEILRLLSPEETAVGKGCGRDGSTAVEIERQSPEKGCGRHTISDGRRGWSSIWWWPGSLCVPPESDAAEMERWL